MIASHDLMEQAVYVNSITLSIVDFARTDNIAWCEERFSEDLRLTKNSSTQRSLWLIATSVGGEPGPADLLQNGEGLLL